MLCFRQEMWAASACCCSDRNALQLQHRHHNQGWRIAMLCDACKL